MSYIQQKFSRNKFQIEHNRPLPDTHLRTIHDHLPTHSTRSNLYSVSNGYKLGIGHFYTRGPHNGEYQEYDLLGCDAV
jgi:hypothetical protein